MHDIVYLLAKARTEINEARLECISEAPRKLYVLWRVAEAIRYLARALCLLAPDNIK
jgi:hypothetical protein